MNNINHNTKGNRETSLSSSMDEIHIDQLFNKYSSEIISILQSEKLNTDILPKFKDVYLPLAALLAKQHTSKPLLIGINGAQGSGKSTLSKIMNKLLTTAFNKSVIHFSIDDLYFSKAQRQHLAKNIHPLLRVRGVPGTHDIELAHDIIDQLCNKNTETKITIPVFNKAIDDRAPEIDWKVIDNNVDIVLFEGWCVGAQAQNDTELCEPVNELERKEDTDARWRTHINHQLKNTYQKLFNKIDYLIMMKVPDMDSVSEWRNLQEMKLKESCVKNGLSTSGVMSPAEIKRFIMHYERITRATLAEMPSRADVVLEINKQHQIDKVILKNSNK